MKTKILTLFTFLSITVIAQTDSIEDRFNFLEGRIDLVKMQSDRKIDAINLRLKKAHDSQMASKVLIATGLLVSSFGYFGNEPSYPIIVFGSMLSATGLIFDIRTWTLIKPK